MSSDYRNLTKFDLAVILALAGGWMYAIGFNYWAAYYKAYGLPLSEGDIGFDRLLLAGVWFTSSLLKWVALIAFLLLACVVVLQRPIKWIRSKPLVASLFRTVRIDFTILRKKRWLLGLVVVFLLSATYYITEQYAAFDGVHDAEAADRGCFAPVQVFTNADFKGFDLNGLSLLLFEQRGSNYYFLTKDHARLIEVPESKVSTIEVASVGSGTCSVPHKKKFQSFVSGFFAFW